MHGLFSGRTLIHKLRSIIVFSSRFCFMFVLIIYLLETAECAIMKISFIVIRHRFVMIEKDCYTVYGDKV